VGPLLALLCAAAATAATPAPLVLDVEPAAFAAARALGAEAMFFTARARPLARLDEIRAPAREVATLDIGGAKEIQALLRASGVKVSGGAVDLMRLVGSHHLASLFRGSPELRFLVVRGDGAADAAPLIERGGGARVLLRSRGQTLGAPAAPAPAAAPGKAAFVTSFGPLVAAELSETARHRQFDAQEGARHEGRRARPGHTFLVLHVERDFSTGVGVVSFLFGSGIILAPDFAALRVADAGNKPYPLAAIHAEGRTLDLAYEVPLAAAGLVLRDGETTFPLAPLLRAGR
jgi:hypothetical protein